MLTFRLRRVPENCLATARQLLRRFGLTSTKSIRFHLFVALLLVAFLPLFALSVALSSKLRTSALKEAQQHVSVVADEIGGRLAELMLTIERNLQSLQSNPRLQIEAERGPEMERLLSIFDDFHDISLYQANGEIIASTNQDGSDPAPYREHTSWFRDAVDSGQRTVSRPTRRIGLEGMFVVVYLPIGSEDAAAHTVIRASLRFDRIQSILQGIDLAKSGQFMLVDELGLVLHDQENRPLPRKLATPFRWEEWVRNPDGQCSLNGIRSVYATRLMSVQETRVGYRWLLIGHLPRAQALSTVEAAIGTIWGFLLVSALGALAVAPVVSNRLVDRLSPLIRAAQCVAEQKWNEVELAEDGPDEIRALSTSFIRMSEEIRQHQDELEQKVDHRTKELAQSRRQLADANAQLEASFHSTLEGVLVVSHEGQVQRVNRRFLEFFGLNPEFADALTIEDLKERAEELAEELPGFSGFDRLLETPVKDNKIRQNQEAEWHLKGAHERFLNVYSVDVSGQEGGDLAKMWVFRDFTESRMLETNLQQAQKMEAVGRLAGGIAHDFNNLLTGIIGNLALVHFETAPDSPTIEDLESAQQAAQRAAELVKQLLGYSRQSFLNLDFCNPNHLVEEVTTFLGRSIDPGIEIETGLSKRIWDVEVDGTQINQVLMNLCVNAKDAMEEKGKGGKLILKTENLNLKAVEARKIHDTAVPGKFVRISVTDTGTGIPPHVLEHIFDPFYTTKGQGKGTGLGLATSLGIVEQHGGWMICDTEPGKGTTFQVYLPKALANAKKKLVQAKTVPEAVGGPETLLLVDDEAVVRGVSEKFLQKKGYNVVSAGDGEAGLEVYDRNAQKVELVMLDLTMPKLSGADTFKELRKRNPNLPIIIYSGYVVDDAQFEAENGSRPNAILCKPFDLNDLALVIREVLEDSQLAMAA